MKRAVVLVSGGMDSAVVLALASEAGFATFALSIAYGQRHSSELAAAACNALSLGAVEHKVVVVDLRSIGGSALTADIAVPEREMGSENISFEVATASNQWGKEMFCDPISDPISRSISRIPITYVPARNTIMLSIALGWAEALDAADIWCGVNAVDYSGYPDCRPQFIAAFETLANLATKTGVEGAGIRVHAPLMRMGKDAIVREGMRLGVDFAQTVSCYQADVEGRACGRCDACLLRAAGFDGAGVPDPTRYRD